MARTVLTPAALPNTHPGGSVVFAFAAADTVNKDEFLLTGREIILISNTDVSSHDVVITSVADPYGRTGDLTVTVAASTMKAVYIGDRSGWMQGGGTLYIDADDATVELAVLRLPAR